ncbi:MAG: hypothetical protein KBG92_09380 [Spirochaetes bacterium]|nr:hypothetical protein [Spirochaetota bacterium]
MGMYYSVFSAYFYSMGDSYCSWVISHGNSYTADNYFFVAITVRQAYTVNEITRLC